LIILLHLKKQLLSLNIPYKILQNMPYQYNIIILAYSFRFYNMSIHLYKMNDKKMDSEHKLMLYSEDGICGLRVYNVIDAKFGENPLLTMTSFDLKMK